MNARHAARKGQPRRAWAPLAPDLLKDPVSVPEWRPSPKQVAALRNRMNRELVEEVRRGPLPLGAVHRYEFEVQEFLAPRRKPARTVARGVRRLVGLGLYTVSVLAAIAMPPVLYAVGV